MSETSYVAPGRTELGRRPQSAPSASQPAAAERQARDNRLIVGPGIAVKGQIEDCDSLEVEGDVEASVSCRSLAVAASGTYRGEARVAVAEIAGRFEGKLTVDERLVLKAGSRLSGTLQYRNLLVEEGAAISGELSLLEGESVMGSLRRAGEARSGNGPKS